MDFLKLRSKLCQVCGRKCQNLKNLAPPNFAETIHFGAWRGRGGGRAGIASMAPPSPVACGFSTAGQCQPGHRPRSPNLLLLLLSNATLSGGMVSITSLSCACSSLEAWVGPCRPRKREHLEGSASPPLPAQRPSCPGSWPVQQDRQTPDAP